MGDSASQPDRLKKLRDFVLKTVDNRIRGKQRQYLEKESSMTDWNDDGQLGPHDINFSTDTGNFIRSLESHATYMELKGLMEEAVHLRKWAAELRLARYESYPVSAAISVWWSNRKIGEQVTHGDAGRRTPGGSIRSAV